MNRSRAIAAGTSVGALIVLTAGVAVANPGSHSSSPSDTNANSGRVRTPDAGSDSGGSDTGWLTPDDGANSGWTSAPPDTGSGSFDPGVGSAGSTRSGGS